MEVYELHVSGAQANVTILARKAAPHYLIKQELTRTGVNAALSRVWPHDRWAGAIGRLLRWLL